MPSQHPTQKKPTANNTTNAMAPAKDEVASFQRRKSSSGYASTENSRAGIYLVLAFLLIVLGGSGFWVQTQISALQTELDKTKTELTTTLSNLAAVNEQLELTDKVLNQPGGAVQKKLALFDSEIRKLWGNYKKQRDLIAKNKKSSATTAANHKNLSNKLTKISKKNIKEDGARDSKITAVSRSISTTKQQIKNTTTKLTAQVTKLQSQIKKLPTQQKSTNLAPLTKQVQGNEEAIVAIDSFRVQTNRTLDRLKKTIASMQKQLEQTSATAP